MVGFDLDAIAAATHAKLNDLVVTFLTRHWKRATRDLIIDPEKFDTAFINSMREPIGECLHGLQTLGVKRIIYPRLAPKSPSRDLARLVEQGYALTNVRAVNLYARTYH